MSVKVMKMYTMNTNPCKAQWYIYVPPGLTINNSTFCTYGFCVIYTVNRNYFLKQHEQVDVSNGEMCFL
jgi:hypothetical protein